MLKNAAKQLPAQLPGDMLDTYILLSCCGACIGQDRGERWSDLVQHLEDGDVAWDDDWDPLQPAAAARTPGHDAAIPEFSRSSSFDLCEVLMIAA